MLSNNAKWNNTLKNHQPDFCFVPLKQRLSLTYCMSFLERKITHGHAKDSKLGSHNEQTGLHCIPDLRYNSFLVSFLFPHHGVWLSRPCLAICKDTDVVPEKENQHHLSLHAYPIVHAMIEVYYPSNNQKNTHNKIN